MCEGTRVSETATSQGSTLKGVSMSSHNMGVQEVAQRACTEQKGTESIVAATFGSIQRGDETEELSMVDGEFGDAALQTLGVRVGGAVFLALKEKQQQKSDDDETLTTTTLMTILIY